MSEDKAQDELLSDSGSEDSGDPEGSEEEVGSWISWFCSLKGNEFFCEVGEDYIQDDFNLSGLSSQVPYYDYALDLILDSESLQNEVLTEQAQEMVEEAAEILYGLIHARYILTSRGLSAMMDKFKNCDFGRCPRVHCNGQACLPVGLSDIPRQSTVKLFCPKCEDVYYPRSKYHGNLDGAYFGTTFAHLFQLTYPQLRPAKPSGAHLNAARCCCTRNGPLLLHMRLAAAAHATDCFRHCCCTCGCLLPPLLLHTRLSAPAASV